MTDTVQASKTSIARAAGIIREGGLVAFPTETVYGLGANALDPRAVARIFAAKERPSFDPLIVHVASLDQLGELTSHTNGHVRQLAEQFWPGPLTIVLPKKDLVPDIVTSGLPTVGIRMPGHPLALELIRAAGCPIAAPSANKFGRISPTRAEHVSQHLPEVDLVLDGGPSGVGIESTIIALDAHGFDILRPGAITREQVEKILPFHPAHANGDSVVAPGMLKSHYSPAKPMYLAGTQPADLDRATAGLLSVSGRDSAGYARVLALSPSRDLQEVAINLFAAMHELENDPEIAAIVAEPVAEEGIGIAVMDRLRKAAHEHLASPGESGP